MQSFQNKTKEMFIVRALEKILTDKDIKRLGQLKKACESAVATLKGSSSINFYRFSLKKLKEFLTFQRRLKKIMDKLLQENIRLHFPYPKMMPPAR
jgi:hypothetical protein